jgi:hypothetical protein
MLKGVVSSTPVKGIRGLAVWQQGPGPRFVEQHETWIEHTAHASDVIKRRDVRHKVTEISDCAGGKQILRLHNQNAFLSLGVELPQDLSKKAEVMIVTAQ